MPSKSSRGWGTAALIVASVAATAVASHLATISHGSDSSPRPAVAAALIVCLAVIPPLYSGRLLSNDAANQLLLVAWRMGIMFPAVALASKYAAAERKCYLITLLACYFVSLLLESWLLIRDVRRKQAFESKS